MVKYISVDDLRAATTKRNQIWNTITDASGRGLDEIIDSLPSADVQPIDVQEAYNRGKIDGVKECMARLKKVNEEFANG